MLLQRVEGRDRGEDDREDGAVMDRVLDQVERGDRSLSRKSSQYTNYQSQDCDDYMKEKLNNSNGEAPAAGGITGPLNESIPQKKLPKTCNNSSIVTPSSSFKFGMK